MTISLSATSIDFGSVITNNKTERSLVLTNPGADPVNVFFFRQGSTTFSITSTVTVPGRDAQTLAPATVTVMVYFEPTAESAVTGSISVMPAAQAAMSVALSGTGVAPHAFQQEAGSYLLMKVPDYGDGQFERRDGTTAEQVTMTSYIRLGTFDWSQESDLAKELLKVIPQSGSPGDPTRSQFYKNYDFDAVSSFDDLPPVKLAADATKDANKAGNRDVFFIDDVRRRAIDTTSQNVDPGHGLTMAQRQRESARLYNRGGWRDHSDGNRISTTYGDKVEVVRGNYKMIVLGRQDNPGEAMGWEVGGSHIQDYAPGTMPGASMFLEWVPDFKYDDASPPTGRDPSSRDGVWLLCNTTENVYQFARTAGNLRDEKWGDVHESYIGSDNPPEADVSMALGLIHVQGGKQVALDDTSGGGGHSVDEDTKIEGLRYGTDTLQRLNYFGITPPFANDNRCNVRGNPHIISKTWARRIDNWTGSSTCWVPVISEKKYVKEAKSEMWAHKVDELTDISTIKTSNTRAGSIFEATTAGTIWEATTCALHVELETSAHIAIEVAAKLDLYFGAKFEFDLAFKGDYSVQEALEVKAKKKKMSLEDLEIAFSTYTVNATDKKSTMDSDQKNLKAAISALQLYLGL